MSRFPFQIAALGLAALGVCSATSACNSGSSDSKTGATSGNGDNAGKAAKPASATTVVLGPSGTQVARLSMTPDGKGCTHSAGAEVTITRDAAGTLVAKDGTDKTLGSVVPNPHGAALRDASGNIVGRVVHPPRLQAVSVIDKIGVAKFRIRVDQKGRAVVRDKASMPVAIVQPRGGRYVVEAKDGTVQAYVTGQHDPIVAALLTAELVEPQFRGLLACDWTLGKTK